MANDIIICCQANNTLCSCTGTCCYFYFAINNKIDALRFMTNTENNFVFLNFTTLL